MAKGHIQEVEEPRFKPSQTPKMCVYFNFNNKETYFHINNSVIKMTD